MNIEQFKKYKARIKYHRTDDLQPDALPDGITVTVRAMWMADDGEKFAGQWIFEPEHKGLWLPECDLEILSDEQVLREHISSLSTTELAALACKLYRPIFDKKRR